MRPASSLRRSPRPGHPQRLTAGTTSQVVTLSEHPAVAQAAVIGRRDDRWGEVPVAFVVPEPGAAPEPESLEQWCTNRLARYKRPREWIFVDDLPRTSLGKVRKHMLPTVAPR